MAMHKQVRVCVCVWLTAEATQLCAVRPSPLTLGYNRPARRYQTGCCWLVVVYAACHPRGAAVGLVLFDAILVITLSDSRVSLIAVSDGDLRRVAIAPAAAACWSVHVVKCGD